MVTLSTYNPQPMALRVSYDQTVDVLHVASGAPSEVEGDGLPNGIELDYRTDDGKPSGVTIIGYLRNGWANNLKELASIISNHLGSDPNEVVEKIEIETRRSL
jgi:hypothetical protein